MSFFKSRGKHTADAVKPAPEPEGSSIQKVAEATKAISELAENERSTDAQAEQEAMDSLYGSEAAPAGGDAPTGGTAPSGPAVSAGGIPVNGAPSGAYDQAEPGSYVSADFNLPSKKKRSLGKVLGITFGVIVAVLAAVYFAGVAVFSNWFPPNTNIGDMNVSLKTSEEVTEMLGDIAPSWKLEVVSGDTFNYKLDASTIKMEVDAEGIAAKMHEDLNPWTWPMLLASGKHDETDRFAVTYSKDELSSQLKSAVDSYNETAEPPQNATIEFKAASNSYEVKPEVLGAQLNFDVVLEEVAQGVDDLAAKVELDERALLQPEVKSDDPKLQESVQMANGMLSAHVILFLGSQAVDSVDQSLLSTFITVDGESNVTFNEDLLNDWVENLAQRYETIGTLRSYTRADGKQISVQGGTFGWEIDRQALKDQLLEAIKTQSTVEMSIPCSSDGAVVAGAGNRDWGARYLDVDLAEQHVYFYDENGALIWESDCISGKPDGEHDTIPGVFTILDKKSPSKLIGYEHGVKIYEAEVQYWMPFERVGIGLHDADWQPGFGGSMYAEGYGSHGCVNLPPSKARELYGLINVGDVVSCHW